MKKHAGGQDCRNAAPFESVPIVEQTTILSDLGMYDLARDRLGSLFEENLDIANTQLPRISQLHKTLEKAAMQDPVAISSLGRKSWWLDCDKNAF